MSKVDYGDFVIKRTPNVQCDIHGEVMGGFKVSHAYENEYYATPELCPKCYVDWVTANVTKVRSLPEAER